jgi:heme/copper-type cytochrome/quinol oxidase subunit 2
MILFLVIVMLLINFIPFVIYYRRFKELKKQDGTNAQYNNLVERMTRASSIISPMMLQIAVFVYVLQ